MFEYSIILLSLWIAGVTTITMTKTLKCIEEWKKHNNKRIPEDVLERIEFLEEELSSAYKKISDIAENQYSAQDDIPEGLKLMG